MGSYELSKESNEEKTIRELKTKIEDLTAENEQYERDLKLLNRYYEETRKQNYRLLQNLEEVELYKNKFKK